MERSHPSIWHTKNCTQAVARHWEKKNLQNNNWEKNSRIGRTTEKNENKKKYLKKGKNKERFWKSKKVLKKNKKRWL